MGSVAPLGYESQRSRATVPSINEPAHAARGLGSNGNDPCAGRIRVDPASATYSEATCGFVSIGASSGSGCDSYA